LRYGLTLADGQWRVLIRLLGQVRRHEFFAWYALERSENAHIRDAAFG
jgi:hypothetical protein